MIRYVFGIRKWIWVWKFLFVFREMGLALDGLLFIFLFRFFIGFVMILCLGCCWWDFCWDCREVALLGVLKEFKVRGLFFRVVCYNNISVFGDGDIF